MAAYLILVPLSVGGLCITMISTPKGQLIISVVTLLVAVAQFILPFVFIDYMINYKSKDESTGLMDAIGYVFVILFICIPILVLSLPIVIMISVNIKLSYDMRKAGGEQSVVHLTTQDGGQQVVFTAPDGTRQVLPVNDGTQQPIVPLQQPMVVPVVQ